MTEKEIHIILRIARLLLKIVIQCLEDREKNSKP